jgi:phosphopantetheinyl transferase
MSHIKLNQLTFYKPLALLPFKLAVASIPASLAPENWQRNRRQDGYTDFGYEVIKLVSSSIGCVKAGFYKQDSGQPYGINSSGERIDVSISHTKASFWCAISIGNRIGIDAELTDRTVSPMLVKRILHPDEIYTLRIEPIRLWTIKESFLKLIGTGLRTNMSSIHIHRVTDQLFATMWNNKPVRIISVPLDSHWFSVAYFN